MISSRFPGLPMPVGIALCWPFQRRTVCGQSLYCGHAHPLLSRLGICTACTPLPRVRGPAARPPSKAQDIRYEHLRTGRTRPSSRTGHMLPGPNVPRTNAYGPSYTLTSNLDVEPIFPAPIDGGPSVVACAAN